MSRRVCGPAAALRNSGLVGVVEDGAMGTLLGGGDPANKETLRACAHAAGYLYEAQLRLELTERFGIEWTEPVKGMAELEHVPKKCNLRSPKNVRRRGSSSIFDANCRYTTLHE